MCPKIVLIGAGSAVFSQRLLMDLASMPCLAGSTVALVDIDRERLGLITRWARRLVRDSGADLRILSTADRRRVLEGADYVISSIDVAFRSRLRDLEICAKYGIVQGVGDTVGPAGMFKGFRVAPVLVEIARDMERLCPDAWFLNHSNPMAICCRCVNLATGIKTLGLCHGVEGTVRLIARTIGLEPEDLDYVAAGVNHLTWLLSVTHKGRDVYPELRRRLEDPEVFAQQPLRFELLQTFGYLPTESDMHDAEYMPYFLHPDRWEKYGLRTRIMNHLERLRSRPDDYAERVTGQLASKEPLKALRRSHERTVRIIEAMETGVNQVIHANIPNRGYISNLPNDAVVEVPALVGPHGVKGIHVGDLPPGPLALTSAIIHHQEMAVKATLTGDRETALHALLTDPLTASILSIEQAKQLLAELYAAAEADKQASN